MLLGLDREVGEYLDFRGEGDNYDEDSFLETEK